MTAVSYRYGQEAIREALRAAATRDLPASITAHDIDPFLDEAGMEVAQALGAPLLAKLDELIRATEAIEDDDEARAFLARESQRAVTAAMGAGFLRGVLVGFALRGGTAALGGADV